MVLEILIVFFCILGIIFLIRWTFNRAIQSKINSFRVVPKLIGVEVNRMAQAVYLRYSDNKVRTTEPYTYKQSTVIFDFDEKHVLVGIELLGPNFMKEEFLKSFRGSVSFSFD